MKADMGDTMFDEIKLMQDCREFNDSDSTYPFSFDEKLPADHCYFIRVCPVKGGHAARIYVQDTAKKTRRIITECGPYEKQDTANRMLFFFLYRNTGDDTPRKMVVWARTKHIMLRRGDKAGFAFNLPTLK